MEQCVTLLNSEWPRSRSSRLWSLEDSCDALPTNLVLTQIIHDEVAVLAHARLSKIPGDDESIFLEQVIVDKAYRGQGIGTYIMKEVETYCTDFLHFKRIYLAIIGYGPPEIFYSKLGYDFCKPLNIYGIKSSNSTNSVKYYMVKELSTWLSSDSYEFARIPKLQKSQKLDPDIMEIPYIPLSSDTKVKKDKRKLSLNNGGFEYPPPRNYYFEDEVTISKESVLSPIDKLLLDVHKIM